MAEPLSIEAFPLFKGCTRPPILFGVPMVPLLSMAIAFLLAGLWFWMPIALCIVPMYFVMKVISKADEFRFRQWALALQLLVPITLAGQRRFWSGGYSWSPATAKRDSRHAQWIVSPPAFVTRPLKETESPADERDEYLRRVLKNTSAGAMSMTGMLSAEQTAGGGFAADEEDARFSLPAVRPEP